MPDENMKSLTYQNQTDEAANNLSKASSRKTWANLIWIIVHIRFPYTTKG